MNEFMLTIGFAMIVIGVVVFYTGALLVVLTMFCMGVRDHKPCDITVFGISSLLVIGLGFMIVGLVVP